MSRHNVVYYYKIGLGPTAAAKNGGMRMRLISWNVNGLRACMGKGFEEIFSDGGRRLLLPSGDETPARTADA